MGQTLLQIRACDKIHTLSAIERENAMGLGDSIGLGGGATLVAQFANTVMVL